MKKLFRTSPTGSDPTGSRPQLCRARFATLAISSPIEGHIGICSFKNEIPFTLWFRAHRILLSAGSVYFRDILAGMTQGLTYKISNEFKEKKIQAPMGILIQLFISVRIRIQGTKPMQIRILVRV
jgi:hypothetical protein